MTHQNGLLIDIETIPAPRAFAWVEPAGNLVDPAKREASKRERQDKLALDPNGCQMVAVGFWPLAKGVWGAPQVLASATDDRPLLEAVRAAYARDTRILGFGVRHFDCPVLMRRAQILRVPFPTWSLARYGKGDVLDLFDELTFHEGTYADGVVPKSLDSFARVFDLPAVTDPGAGKLVSTWVKDGRLDLVIQHCMADLYREAHLGARLGLWPEPPIEPSLIVDLPAFASAT